MITTQLLLVIILITLFIFFLIRILKKIFFKTKNKKIKKRKSVFLSAKIKNKAERKYKKILFEFKKKHRHKPSKDDLFRIVIAASHHTYPVKGKNVRRWTKGKTGHWNRQKVRKYLLEKYDIVKKYRMK